MPRRDLLRKLLCDLGNTASPSHSHEVEKRGNFGIREFPPRADLPPLEISEVDVEHADIIAVRGLGGNWLKTWKADDGAIWLRDRLPQLLARKNIQARVLTFGYAAGFVFTKTVNDIEMVARDLLNQVNSIRTEEEQKEVPIILVAHSLGGLVVKTKSLDRKHSLPIIVDRATGCIFLSVPHQGADLAYWAKNAATIMGGLGNKRLVRAISKSSDEWMKVGWDFVFRAPNVSIGTVYETQRTKGIMVVNEHSARLSLPGEKIVGLPRSDHRNVCKFGDSPDESDRFRVLGNLVTEVVQSALERGRGQ